MIAQLLTLGFLILFSSDDEHDVEKNSSPGCHSSRLFVSNLVRKEIILENYS